MRIYYQILITVTTLIVGIGIIFAIVILPSLKSIVSLAESIEQERVRVEQIVSRALQSRQTVADVEKVAKDLLALESMLISANKEIQLFTILEQKSKTYGLIETLHLKEDELTQEQNVKKMSLGIELQGPFLNTLHFIDDIEHSTILLPFQLITQQYSPTIKKDIHPLTSTLRGMIYVAK